MKTFSMRGLVTLGACACALLAACSGERESDGPAGSPDDGEVLLNVCPPEGCRVEITAAERQAGELELSFEANFAPDLARNHLHVYWDNFSTEQVSVDAAVRFGVRQGDWAETDENPYVTGGAASVGARGESMSICATASDLNHGVIDPQLADCFDVGELVL